MKYEQWVEVIETTMRHREGIVIEHDSDGNPCHITHDPEVVDLAAQAAMQQISKEAAVTAIETIFRAHQRLVPRGDRGTT